MGRRVDHSFRLGRVFDKSTSFAGARSIRLRHVTVHDSVSYLDNDICGRSLYYIQKAHCLFNFHIPNASLEMVGTACLNLFFENESKCTAMRIGNESDLQELPPGFLLGFLSVL